MGQIDERADEIEAETVVIDRMADFLMVGLEKCKGGGIVLQASWRNSRKTGTHASID